MSFTHEFVQGNSPWTLLMLHGTGGDERDLLPLGSSLMADASLLSPLGKVREGSAPRFFKRLSEGVFDMEDLIFRTNELADWLLVAYSEHGIDADKVIAIGYSNGATVASSLLLLRPEVLKGAVALRPSVPFVPEQLPRLRGKSALYLSGAEDMIVPAAQGAEVARIIREAGGNAIVEIVEAGHGLVRRDIDLAQAWLASFTAEK